VRKFPLEELAGLTTETLDVARPIVPSLGQPLLLAKFNVLDTDVATMLPLMNKSHGSSLTSQLQTIDGDIGGLFSETKRIIKAFETSGNTIKADAAKLLLKTVKPYWNVTSKRYASQSALLEELFARVNANPALNSAINTLELTNTWQQLVAANVKFNVVYDQRLAEEAAEASPAASTIKETVVVDYESFCVVLEQTLSVLPSPQLENLFVEMNELRKKYAPRHRTKLDDEHTTVEQIAAQAYNGGKPVTPLPKVWFKTDSDSETVELEFTKDYEVSYKNNISVGEATIVIHGKGKYTGQHATTFYIVQA
jgi:hypothetical protein